MVTLLMLSELKCTQPYLQTSVHTYGMKNSSGASSSTYLNFRSGNFCKHHRLVSTRFVDMLELTRKRSLDHWLAPFDITSSTSLTPSSPRCSCTRCSREEKKPTTCKRMETVLDTDTPTTRLSYHIDILYDILESVMTAEALEDAALVEQCVDQVGTVDKLIG